MLEVPTHAQNVEDTRGAYGLISRPLPAKLLKILRLDKVFHSGEGVWLSYLNSRGKEKRVLDCLGGYGAGLLGHASPELTQIAIQSLKNRTPVFAQMSIPGPATRLMETIREVASRELQQEYLVHLVNTGTEATEAALKHSRLVFFDRLETFQQEFERRFAQIQAGGSFQFSTQIAGDWPVAADELPSLFSLKSFKNQLSAQNSALLKANSPGFLSAEKGYHGKTLSALQVTWNPRFREPFHGESLSGDFFPLEIEALEKRLKAARFQLVLPKLNFKGEVELEYRNFNRIAGVLLEPIQGEGGIRPLCREFLQKVSSLCNAYKVPLILDEIQSGSFRTGRFLASSNSGIEADYYLLGKALGGGMVKVAALLIEKSIYREDFGLLHSSTYAEDGLSSQVAEGAIGLLAKRARDIQKTGDQLKARLNQLQDRFSEVVQEVRGEGLMLGIEFRDYTLSANVGLQLLARTGYLSYVYAGFLLNKWGIRVGAPLSHPNTLRIQPAVCIDESDMDKLIEGLKDLCRILKLQDLYKLIEYTLPSPYKGLRKFPEDFRQGEIELPDSSKSTSTVGFISHFIHEGTVQEAVPALAILDRECIDYLLKRILPIGEAILLGSQTIKSKTGKTVELLLSGLCVTSAICREGMNRNQVEVLQELCHRGVELLEDNGAEVVGMGQFTSILTENCRTVPNSNIGLTSGNSFTTYLGFKAILEALRKQGRDPEEESLAVIGAGGNIGRVYADLFAGKVSQIRLLGSPGPNGFKKAQKAVREIYGSIFRALDSQNGTPQSAIESKIAESFTYREARDHPVTMSAKMVYKSLEAEFGEQLPIRAVETLQEIKDCGIVVVATNAPQPFLKPEHFEPGTIICDVSVPVNCTPELLENTSGIQVLLGGVAQLPNAEEIPIGGYPLEPGQVFGCLAETLLLGLEEWSDSYSYGRIRRDQVEKMGEIATHHGFTLSNVKRKESY